MPPNKKGGKTRRAAATRQSPGAVSRVDGGGELQCDAILSSTSDNRVDANDEWFSLNPNTSVNDAIISVGDVVQIKGLISAPQFNGKMGCVVSDVDPTTNRCGVKLHSNKIMGIQVQNLIILTKSKSDNEDDEDDTMIRLDRGYLCIEEKGKIVGQHVMSAILWCSDDSRKMFALQKDNYDSLVYFLENCNNEGWHPSMVKTTRSIINKWLSQSERPSGFIRFLNGIKTECYGANLEFVSLRDAMMYLEEWTVDWDMQLTSKEIDLVKDPTWRASLLRYTQNDGQGLRYNDAGNEAKRDPQDRAMYQHPYADGDDSQARLEGHAGEYLSGSPHINTPAEKLSASDSSVFSVGDTVRLNGLISASQYNGMKGIIVSELDATTNRCGVRVTGTNAKVMAIQVTNLTLERKAKKSTIGDTNVDRVGGSPKPQHLAVACQFCDEDERLTLVEQNNDILQNYEDGIASHYNKTELQYYEDGIASHYNKMERRLLNSIIKKWREQATMGFIRFLNGNMTDCRVANLQFVSLRDALLHFEEWTVDLCINLTEQEIDAVVNSGVRQLLVHHQQCMTNCEVLHDEIEDGMDANNDQRGQSSPLPVLAAERVVISARAVPTTHNTTYQVKRIMNDIRKCKLVAVDVILSTIRKSYKRDYDSFQKDLVDNGLISVVLGFLRLCEHTDFNDVVEKVKGNIQTPADWMEILACFGNHDQCRLEIANGIQAVVRCLCDDTKRLFFNSNKHWHEAMPHFLRLVSNLLSYMNDEDESPAMVCNILLQNEGFLESVVQKALWTSYRPDLVKEYESHSLLRIQIVETSAHMAISDLIRIGNEEYGQEYLNDSDEEENLFTVVESISQDGLNLLKTIAKIPVVSRVYDPECNVNYVVGLIRLLKNVKSNAGDRWKHFDILSLFTNNAHHVDNGIIAEVIELGSKFIANIDEASDTNIEEASDFLRICYSMMMRRADEKVFPIDKRIAVAIKSSLLEMCFGFITRFECAHGVYGRDELMDGLVCIAEVIQQVALHQNTSKAIRDRRCQTVEALNSLLTKIQSKQSTQFVDILSSVMELNEGSCSRCNKLIEWHTALFCEGCRRVAYCGVKCQKKDWKYGTHSSDCSFLARSSDVILLTNFDVKSSRNISELTGLRNNIVTSQKKLFLRHEVSISSQLLTLPDRSDYIALFDTSNQQRPISFRHYYDQFTCVKQRKWFEDFRSPDKVICLFISDVFNGEINEEGNANRIVLYAAFSIPNRIQSSFTLYATATMKNVKSRNPEFNSSEIFATLKNMFQALPSEELLHWEEKAALVRANPSVSPHICDVAFKKSTAKKGSARKKFVKEMRPKIISEKPDLTPLEK